MVRTAAALFLAVILLAACTPPPPPPYGDATPPVGDDGLEGDL
ncbi:hypothetical protein HNP73_001320 [Amaricoccus macauensis]|uniref:Argininosuccinate lyase n=1 Tax=Amaricoccus macauensis TaxID=57001 RepID=A0A840SER8_9RHOB|nr:hypothetical protein [Amaricoccus macauensis]MBB5221399.1 hypothetical protein [Amaricoccus macauensis]